MGRSKKRGQGDGGSPKEASPKGRGKSTPKGTPADAPAAPAARPGKPPLLEMPLSPGERPAERARSPGASQSPGAAASLPANTPSSMPATTPSRRSLMSPTVSSANRTAPEEYKPRPRTGGTPGAGECRRTAPTTPGRMSPRPRTRLQSPRSVVSSTRSTPRYESSTRSTPRSPWIQSPLNVAETSAVFRPKEVLEKERRGYNSRNATLAGAAHRAGSPENWRDGLGSRRHMHSVVYEVPPDPDDVRTSVMLSPRGPPLPPQHLPCKEHATEWKSVIRSAEDIFGEFLGDSKMGKFLQRGMSPRRTEKDFVSGLREDRADEKPTRAARRPEWKGVRPESPHQVAAWQQVPPRTCAGPSPGEKPTSQWTVSVSNTASSTDAAFPPPCMLIRERLRASGTPGMLSPRKAEPSWESMLCNGKKQTDDLEREELNKIPTVDESTMDISAISVDTR